MTMREERNIIITMNPDQLRKLADKMEQAYPTLKIGDSTFVDFLGYKPDLRVSLHLDQEWFNTTKTGQSKGSTCI